MTEKKTLEQTVNIFIGIHKFICTYARSFMVTLNQ